MAALRGVVVRKLALALLALSPLAIASCGPAAAAAQPTPTRGIVASATFTPGPGETAVAAAIATATPVPRVTATPTPPPVRVSVTDGGFSPNTLVVPRGTFVVWSNDGAAHHTVTDEGYLFDSGSLAVGQLFTFTFIQPGTYHYHCGWFPNLRGTVIVQ